MAEHATPRPQEVIDLKDLAERLVPVVVAALNGVGNAREPIFGAECGPFQVACEGVQPLSEPLQRSFSWSWRIAVR